VTNCSWATLPEVGNGFNVLFIAVDDLKPALGCYGDPAARTPHIDRLAKQGTVFLRAYCQQAVCSPSRSSLLTGRRPDSTGVHDLVTHFRTKLPNVVTLPQHFKNHGYYVHGIGKIYHGGYDDPPSWSVPWEASKGKAWGPEGLRLQTQAKTDAKAAGRDPAKFRGPAWEHADVDDTYLTDGWTARRAVEVLKSRKDSKQPFFLAVGFVKPHLPFVSPKKYGDAIRNEVLPVAVRTPIDGAPTYAPQNGGELRVYHSIPKTGPIDAKTAASLVHAYYAAASYMDAQVGILLDALEEFGLAKNTVIVLWGDHGWHLGDHGMWCKHTNYEQATRVPLIVSAPNQKARRTSSNRLVELVDLYPTLVEACGLPRPDGLEGSSFVPLLDHPHRTWKTAAFSQYPRGGKGIGRLMGYSMRTSRYRYIEWRNRNTGEVIDHELYDYETDPHENRNLAKDPSNSATVKELEQLLARGWQGNKPT
jgi:arylsulfatase A-like enzyme